MAQKQPTAIIAGGGIGGLNAALCLHKFGWNAVILEQAEAIAEVGAGIQISPNGMKVLQALNLDKEMEVCAFRPEASQFRLGRSGRIIFTSSMAHYEQKFGAPYLHVHRADLIATLKNAVEERMPGALRTDQNVTSYGQDANGAWANLSDGSLIRGDILIGADGIKSVIRSQMLGPEAPRFTGNVAWRAVVPVEKLGGNIPPPTACVWAGEGKHAVTYLLRGGTLANLVAIIESDDPRDDGREEGWMVEGTREDALADFRGWHPVITTLLEQAENHHKWALFDRSPLEKWNEGRVVLLGDACHPMLPFMAQGAVQALEDGYVLARLLTKHDNHITAFDAYFAARRAPPGCRPPPVPIWGCSINAPRTEN